MDRDPTAIVTENITGQKGQPFKWLSYFLSGVFPCYNAVEHTRKKEETCI